MFVLRFIRKDRKPVEEYYYHSEVDALSHLHLFTNDDSSLYESIVLISLKTATIIDALFFED